MENEHIIKEKQLDGLYTGGLKVDKEIQTEKNEIPLVLEKETEKQEKEKQMGLLKQTGKEQRDTVKLKFNPGHIEKAVGEEQKKAAPAFLAIMDIIEKSNRVSTVGQDSFSGNTFSFVADGKYTNTIARIKEIKKNQIKDKEEPEKKKLDEKEKKEKEEQGDLDKKLKLKEKELREKELKDKELKDKELKDKEKEDKEKREKEEKKKKEELELQKKKELELKLKKEKEEQELQKKKELELKQKKEEEEQAKKNKYQIKDGKKLIIDKDLQEVADNFNKEHGERIETLKKGIMSFVEKNKIQCKVLTIQTIDDVLQKSSLVKGQIRKDVAELRDLLTQKKAIGDQIDGLISTRRPESNFVLTPEKTEEAFAALDKIWVAGTRPANVESFRRYLAEYSEDVYRVNPLLGYEVAELAFSEKIGEKEEKAFRYLNYYFNEMQSSQHLEIQKIQYKKSDFYTPKEVKISDYEAQTDSNCWCCSGIAMLRQYIRNKYGEKSSQYKAARKKDQYSLRSFVPDYLTLEEVDADPDQAFILNELKADHEEYAGKGKTEMGNVFDSSDFFIPFAPEAYFHKQTFTIPPIGKEGDVKTRDRNDRIYNNMIYYFMTTVKKAVDSGNVLSVLIQNPQRHYLTIVGISKTGKIRYKDSLNGVNDLTNPEAAFGERIYECNVEDYFLCRDYKDSSQVELTWMEDSTKLDKAEKDRTLAGAEYDKERGYHTKENNFMEMGRRYGCAIEQKEGYEETVTGGNVGEIVYVPQPQAVRTRLRKSYLAHNK